MPRTLLITFFFLATVVLAAGLALAGIVDSTLVKTDWMIFASLVLFMVTALGIRFREKHLNARRRVAVKNPGQDHSNRSGIPKVVVRPSAIFPPQPADFALADLTMSVTEARQKYRQFLRWTTNLFGSIRVFTYVPTILTLWASADSSQYSLLTWGAWIFANASLTASIYEQNGRKVDNLVLVNFCNTVMCLVTVIVILYLRHI